MANDVQSVDLRGRAFTNDPHAYWTELRHRDPIHWDESERAWLLTRYEDVESAFFDPRLSSDRIRPLLGHLSPDRKETMGPVLSVMAEWLSAVDPPVHTRLRSLANEAFRGQRIARMRSWIGDICDDLLNDFLASRSTDFMTDIAQRLPALVIARMMGAKADEAHLFQRWSDELALVIFSSPDDRSDEGRAARYARAQAGLQEMESYVYDLIARARTSPGEDMISALVHADASGFEPLTEREIVGLATLILFAGHETTANLLCNFVTVLTSHPDLQEELLADSSRVPDAIEEVLRFEGPVRIIVRWVLEDHTRGDKLIRKDDRVYLVLQSANRDENVFDHPDVLNIDRPSEPAHIAFGRGIHSCLGAQLARLEARIAIPKILERLPHLRARTPIEWKPNIGTRAVSRLHVEFEQGA